MGPVVEGRSSSESEQETLQSSARHLPSYPSAELSVAAHMNINAAGVDQTLIFL